MSRLLCAIAASALLLGCDGVGRAVVGEHWPAGGEEICEEPRACVPIVLDDPRGVPEVVAPVDLGRCMRAAAALCPRGAVSGSGSCQEAASVLEVDVSEPAAAAALRELSCRSVHVTAAASMAHHIDIGAWTEVQLGLESSEPTTLELSGGTLNSVSLALHGPITLRLLDVQQGSDVRVLADNARAQVELVRTTFAGVLLSVPDGAVLLRRSTLQNAAVSAGRLDVESAFVRDTVWQTGYLSAADATLTRVRSEARRSVLSACNVDMTSFLACQSLSTIDGTLSHVRVAACAEEAALYGSDLLHAQLEGDLILDRAALYDSVLGVGELGAIMAWDSKLSDISFCAAQQAFSAGGSTVAHCAHCDLTPEPSEPEACTLDGALLRATKSESCPKLDQPPRCGDPQPQRMRPPLH